MTADEAREYGIVDEVIKNKRKKGRVLPAT